MNRQDVTDMELGRAGIWSLELRFGDQGETSEAAAELEELGWGALWLGDVFGGDVLADAGRLLDATSAMTVATGVLNLWAHDPATVAAAAAGLDGRHPGRFLLGLGVSSPESAASAGQVFRRPVERVARYLDDLDGAPQPAPARRRVLGALGPKMLRLAARRAAGAHPFLVTPGHTAAARGLLGAGPLLAPHQAVVLDTDPGRARALIRASLALSLTQPHYQGNLRRLGFGPDDLAGGGTDRLVDSLVAWGDEEAVSRRIREHHDAGADHVAVHVVSADPGQLPRAQWRALAAALGG
jgi:probable F420-dependent oxidoreductase